MTLQNARIFKTTGYPWSIFPAFALYCHFNLGLIPAK